MTTTRIVVADHPTLERDLDRFADELWGSAHSSSERDTIAALRVGGGFRLAALQHGRMIGVARIADDGEVTIAVAPDHRGVGLDAELGRAALDRAIELGFTRLSA